MGIFDRIFGRRSQPVSAVDVNDTHIDAPNRAVASDDTDVSNTYTNRNVTYRGDLSGCNYDALLRDKQRWENWVTLCKLANYYVDKDPLFRGIIKEVYTPFTLADHWVLVGGDESIKQKYEKYYEQIGMSDFMESVFYEFWLYANVVIYLMPDGELITLPFNLIRIGNVRVNGEPIVEYHCREIYEDYKFYKNTVLREYIQDEELPVRLEGLPPEVIDGLEANVDWVQLKPSNTFVLQDIKEEWLRYCPPLVTTCLCAFRKKELISEWEDSQLNLGIHSFLHVKYGDPKNEVIPDKEALMLVGQTFRNAMTRNGLAVTNNWAEPKFHQPDLDTLFSEDKYKSCNSDILDAGGISGIIVSGRAEDGSTFASAQVSMQTAAKRIQRAKDKFCEMMDKINRRVNDIVPSFPHSNSDRIPSFKFPPTDLTGDSNFLKTCETLYAKGMLSNETYLNAYKFDYKQEIARKKKEQANGVADLFVPPQSKAASSGNSDSSGERGRPTMDENERHSDPSKTILARQPKASNPAGSEAHEDSIKIVETSG